jgi:hypothetical protein
MAVNGQAQFLIVKQAFSVGYAPSADTPYVVEMVQQSDAVTGTQLWSLDGQAYQYVTISSVEPAMWTSLTSVGNQAAAIYESLYGTEIGLGSLEAFDGVWALANAINAAGSTDSAAIIAALKALNIPGSQFQITFPENVPDPCLWHTPPTITVAAAQYQVIGPPANNGFNQAPMVFPPSLANAPLLGPASSDTFNFQGYTSYTSTVIGSVSGD